MSAPNVLRDKDVVFNAGSITRRVNRVLVTGFIGSHLIDKLMEDPNNDVICVDNLYSGSKSNIQHHIGKANFEFMRHDITLPLYVEVDQIYHLACPASPVFYQLNGIKTIKTSVMGTMNTLGLATRLNCKWLTSSTSEVYGDPLVHPQTESYFGNVNPIGIRSCYDEGKRIAETIAFEYHRKHNTKIKVARIFNTYGPRMLENDGRVVSNFIVQSLLQQQLTVYGAGQQTRSFCYVSDMVRGLMALMQSDDSVVGPINIGNPTEHTILQLATQISDIVNPHNSSSSNSSTSNVVHHPVPSDDPTRRKPDITLAQKHLQWTPTVDLTTGLHATIDYFRSIMVQPTAAAAQ